MNLVPSSTLHIKRLYPNKCRPGWSGFTQAVIANNSDHEEVLAVYAYIFSLPVKAVTNPDSEEYSSSWAEAEQVGQFFQGLKCPNT